MSQQTTAERDFQALLSGNGYEDWSIRSWMVNRHDVLTVVLANARTDPPTSCGIDIVDGSDIGETGKLASPWYINTWGEVVRMDWVTVGDPPSPAQILQIVSGLVPLIPFQRAQGGSDQIEVAVRNVGLSETLSEELRSAFSSLNKQQQMVVVLRLHGLSFVEIDELVGIDSRVMWHRTIRRKLGEAIIRESEGLATEEQEPRRR